MNVYLKKLYESIKIYIRCEEYILGYSAIILLLISLLIYQRNINFKYPRKEHTFCVFNDWITLVTY